MKQYLIPKRKTGIVITEDYVFLKQTKTDHFQTDFRRKTSLKLIQEHLVLQEDFEEIKTSANQYDTGDTFIFVLLEKKPKIPMEKIVENYNNCQRQKLEASREQHFESQIDDLTRKNARLVKN